jgi:hypothetical protein
MKYEYNIFLARLILQYRIKGPPGALFLQDPLLSLFNSLLCVVAQHPKYGILCV